MKKLYSCLSVALVSMMSLASCSRSNYAFQPGSGSYHTSATVIAAEAEKPVVESTTKASLDAQPKSVATTVKKVGKATSAKVALAPNATHKSAVKAISITKADKSTVVEKALASKVLKKVKKHSDTTGVDNIQSKAGKAAIVALVGLLLLLLGGLAGIGIVALLGLLALIVGFVMLIVSLINS